ncbi:hypothetical protein [Pradoshia eiseniae]|nr:hypothetical protein [Pradoshia eiseniae]
MMKWILIAIGIFLLYVILEEAITRYLYKLQESITLTSDNADTKEESL